MKVLIYCLYITSFLFLSSSLCKLSAQENTNNLVPSGSNMLPVGGNSDNEFAHIFICYPIAKSGTGFSLFLNNRNIAKLKNGARLECRLLLEGPVAVTVIDGNKYIEPLTQANNSRTITIKKGKPYYFRVSGSGGLEYIMNVEKGGKSYANAKEFIHGPGLFTETASAGIPALETIGK